MEDRRSKIERDRYLLSSIVYLQIHRVTLSPCQVEERTMPEALDRFLDEQLNSLKEQGLFRTFRILEGPQGARARIDGKDVINLSSNNYLGLANHPQLKQAAIGAIE